MIRIYRGQSLARKIILGLSLIVSCSTVALPADTITGVARNQTTGRFAAGDEVFLLCLDHNMQDEARAKTDSHGVFTLRVRYPDKLHLVRVLHQGVNYDQRASTGGAVSVDVFDAATTVQGVSASIEIIRAGTNRNLLHVSDMIEIRNDSRPPLTQAGERTFEVYLPSAARIDSVLAAGAGKIGLMISATPVPRQPGHYTVNFPLRPGTTKFAFNYDLPYDESRAAFHTWSMYPLQQLAVMLPPTMKFTSQSSAFQVLPTENSSYQVEAANRVNAGEGPGFEISGVGVLPPVQVQSSSKPPAVALPTPAISTLVGSVAKGGDANPSAPLPASAPSSRLQWWALGAGIVLALGVYGFAIWPRKRRSAARLTRTAQPRQIVVSRAEVLREELSRLEIDRSQGTISAHEYDSAKQALEGTVRRALARTGTER